MARKDFSEVKTDRVYNTIAEATQDTQETQEAQETIQKPKERRKYTAEERKAFQMERKTAGRRGVKLERINMAFMPDVYQYISIMSRVRGESMTDFVNIALRESMEAYSDLYEKAIAFRDALGNL